MMHENMVKRSASSRRKFSPIMMSIEFAFASASAM